MCHTILSKVNQKQLISWFSANMNGFAPVSSAVCQAELESLAERFSGLFSLIEIDDKTDLHIDNYELAPMPLTGHEEHFLKTCWINHDMCQFSIRDKSFAVRHFVLCCGNDERTVTNLIYSAIRETQINNEFMDQWGL